MLQVFSTFPFGYYVVSNFLCGCNNNYINFNFFFRSKFKCATTQFMRYTGVIKNNIFSSSSIRKRIHKYRNKYPHGHQSPPSSKNGKEREYCVEIVVHSRRTAQNQMSPRTKTLTKNADSHCPIEKGKNKKRHSKDKKSTFFLPRSLCSFPLSLSRSLGGFLSSSRFITT